MITTHILYPDWLPQHIISDTRRLVEGLDGPLQWRFVPLDFEPPKDYGAIAPVFEGKWPTYVELKTVARKIVAEPEMSPLVTPPPMESSIDENLPGFKGVLQNYCAAERIDYHIQSRNRSMSDFFMILTTRGTTENLFEYAVPFLAGARVFQVNHSVMTRIPAHIFLAYHAISLPLRMKSVWDDRTFDPDYGRLKPWGHARAVGCINDIDLRDMQRALIKLKTADVCDDCMESLRSKVDVQSIVQVQQGLDRVRQLQMRFDRLVNTMSLSKLRVGRKLRLVDLGQTLPLPPRVASIYLTFLEAGEQGIVLKQMDEYVDRLRHWYGYLYKGSDSDAIATSISKVLDPQDSTLNELISRANAGIRRVLGERGARPYLILGQKGEAYSIGLERNLIIWPEDTQK